MKEEGGRRRKEEGGRRKEEGRRKEAMTKGALASASRAPPLTFIPAPPAGCAPRLWVFCIIDIGVDACPFGGVLFCVCACRR